MDDIKWGRPISGDHHIYLLDLIGASDFDPYPINEGIRRISCGVFQGQLFGWVNGDDLSDDDVIRRMADALGEPAPAHGQIKCPMTLHQLDILYVVHVSSFSLSRKLSLFPVPKKCSLSIF